MFNHRTDMWQITVYPNHINIVNITYFENFYNSTFSTVIQCSTRVLSGIESVAYNINGKQYDLKR